MRITRLRLRNFRAHEDTTVEFAPGVNVLVGANGAGKTNVLEAIHVLCLSRSFLASSDRYVLRKGAEHYEVEGAFQPDARKNGADAAARAGRPVRVRVAWARGQGKKVTVNGAPLERVSDLVGRVPVVVFSPGDHRITSEGPDERRRMLDTIMCQFSPVYMEALMRYRRVLKQRNELLHEARRRRRDPDPTLMESWTEEFVRLAAAITSARLGFIDEFAGFLQQAYERVSDVTERPSMTYEPISGVTVPTEADALADRFHGEIERTRNTERERGATQVGPHRDEIVMRLGRLPVRRYASQGQHRTFGMALKLAQYEFLTDRTGEYPVLLLDDVFDNLDPDRIRAFLGVLASDVTGQSITTAARREIVIPYFRKTGRETGRTPDRKTGPTTGRKTDTRTGRETDAPDETTDSCHVVRIEDGQAVGTETVRRDRQAPADVSSG